MYKIQHLEKPELVYIGHTIRFDERMKNHKCATTCERNSKYNRKLYSKIREYGGWDKFNMTQIKVFSCSNKREAELEENRLILEYKADLNTYLAHNDYEKSEKRTTQRKKYEGDHKEDIYLRKKKYREENKDRLNEYNREYRKKKKEREQENKTIENGPP